MSGGALWSALSYPANSFTYSPDRLTATGNGPGASGRLNGFVGVGITSGRFRFSVQYVGSGYSLYGLANTSDSLTNNSGNPANSFLVNTNNGAIILMTAGSQTVPGSIASATAGCWFDFVFDTGSGSGTSGTAQAWVRVNGGPWNGNSAANPDTNTGGIACPQIASWTPINQIYNNVSGNPVVLNAGATPYAYTMPTTFADLPATLNMSVNSVQPGNAVTMSWSDGTSQTGLNYSLDGGTWTACSSGATGTSGVAVGPTIATQSFHTIALQSAGLPIDETLPLDFYATTAPSGAGTLVYMGVGSGLSSVGVTFSLPSLPGFVFDFYMAAFSPSGQQLTGGNSLDITCATDLDNYPSYITAGNFQNLSLPGANQALQTGLSGYTPNTGPVTVQIGDDGMQTKVSGIYEILTSGSSTSFTATITNNGTISTFEDGLAADEPFIVGTITSGVIYPDYDTQFSYYLAVYAIEGPETLTITGASYNAGTLTIDGGYSNTTLTALNISDNGGSSFSAASSLSVGTGTYVGTLDTTLEPGVYSLQTQDATTGVLSNFYTLTLDTLYVSQVVEQVLMQIQDTLMVSQVVEQVLLVLPQFNRVGLFQTDVVPNAQSSYTEFGAELSWNYETILLPDSQNVSANSVVVSTLDLAFVGASPVVAVQANDSADILITQAAIVPTGTDSLWDEAVWDVNVWDGTPSPLSPWQIPWPVTVVFRQMTIAVSGYSVAGTRIGNLYLQYQPLGYVAQQPSGTR